MFATLARQSFDPSMPHPSEITAAMELLGAIVYDQPVRPSQVEALNQSQRYAYEAAERVREHLDAGIALDKLPAPEMHQIQVLAERAQRLRMEGRGLPDEAMTREIIVLGRIVGLYKREIAQAALVELSMRERDTLARMLDLYPLSGGDIWGTYNGMSFEQAMWHAMLLEADGAPPQVLRVNGYVAQQLKILAETWDRGARFGRVFGGDVPLRVGHHSKRMHALAERARSAADSLRSPWA